jgi:hypothetical protein
MSRSSFYETEKRFIQNGLPGLLFFSDSSKQYPDLEQLSLLAKKIAHHSHTRQSIVSLRQHQLLKSSARRNWFQKFYGLMAMEFLI